MKVTFEFERTTKNTHRYQETSDLPAIGTLYVQKYTIKELTGSVEPPKHLVLTIETLDD